MSRPRFEQEGVGHGHGVDARAARQLGSFAGGPAAVLLSMQAKSVAVPWACAHQNMLVLHAAALAGMAVALGSGAVAFAEWRRAGGGWPDAEGGERGRSRFLGLLAMLVSGVSIAIMLAQWIPDFILSPCQH